MKAEGLPLPTTHAHRTKPRTLPEVAPEPVCSPGVIAALVLSSPSHSTRSYFTLFLYLPISSFSYCYSHFFLLFSPLFSPVVSSCFACLVRSQLALETEFGLLFRAQLRPPCTACFNLTESSPLHRCTYVQVPSLVQSQSKACRYWLYNALAALIKEHMGFTFAHAHM